MAEAAQAATAQEKITTKKLDLFVRLMIQTSCGRDVCGEEWI